MERPGNPAPLNPAASGCRRDQSDSYGSVITETKLPLLWGVLSLEIIPSPEALSPFKAYISFYRSFKVGESAFRSPEGMRQRRSPSTMDQKEIDDEFLFSKKNYPQEHKFTSYQTNSLLLFGYGVQCTWWRFTTLFTESCNWFLPQWYLRYLC